MSYRGVSVRGSERFPVHNCTYVTKSIRFCDMSMISASEAIRKAPEGSFVRVSTLPGSPQASRQAASRASRKGELVAIRPGLYYRGAPTRYGLSSPRVEDVVRAVLGDKGVGPAGFSAAREWGMTTQIPATYQVATMWAIAPIEGVTQHTRRNRARWELNSQEIALLELLRDPEVYVEAGWDCLIARYREARAAGWIREELLRPAVEGERNRAVRAHFSKLMSDAASV